MISVFSSEGKRRSIALLVTFFVIISLAIVTAPKIVKAATLLSDDFTGTTIDTNKWVEFDSAGAGGTSGHIQQNGTLSITNSFSGTWGATALYSADTFDSDGLEISAYMTRGSDQLLGYGDYNFQSAGTKTYIIDLQSSNVLALAWNNGSLVNNSNCGAAVSGATYMLKIVSGGFDIYRNGSKICGLTTGVSIQDKPIFLQSEATASTFDDVLVTGTASGPSAPGAPTSLSADPGDTQVALSWTTPASDGDSAITDYLVEYKLATEPTTWTTFVDGTSTNTSTTITGLTNGQQYNFRISAINMVGTSAASSTATATPTAPTVPSIPGSVTATPSNTQVTITWVAPASNGSAITDYIVQYKLNTEPTTWTTFADGTSTNTTATITGLTNDTAYNFRIAAVNGIGTGAASSPITATPVEIGYVLTDDFTGTTINTSKWIEVDAGGLGGTAGAVQQNDSLSVANSYVGGAWGATALVSQDRFNGENLEISAKMINNSSQILGYGDYLFGESTNKAYLLYLSSGGNGVPIWAIHWQNGAYGITSSCGTTTTGAVYTLKVIPDGFEVYKDDVLQCTHNAGFSLDNTQVMLQTQGAASTFDDLQVYGTLETPSVPDAPTIGSATADNAQATVTFTPPTSNGGSAITQYTVTASPGDATATGSASPITITGLTNTVAYTFTVTATNGVGTSAPSAASNSVTPTIPAVPGQVTNVEATGVNRQALVAWDAPGSGGTPTDYVVQYKPTSSDTWITFTDGTSTALKTVVTGLINGTAYHFRVFATNGGGNGAASSEVSTTPHDLGTLAFVITGESNSGGIGLNSDASAGELASRPSVQIMNLTSGLFGFENLDIGTNNLRDHSGLEGYYDNSHGFELGLANAVEAHYFPGYSQVYLIKTGQGGSKVAEWNVGGSYWNKFLQRTAAAKTQLPEERQWVVWLSLGINDSIANTPTNTWKSAMVDHINKIKAELPGSIIILTQFQSMTAGSGYPTYNAVMTELAAEQANVFVVDSTGAGLRDGNHWSYSGVKTVAERLAEVTRTSLGLTFPSAPLSLSATPSSTSVALTWNAPDSNGGAAVTDYKVEYKLSSGDSWTIFADGTSPSTGAIVNGLSDGMSYDFRVSAVNSNGAGAITSATATTTDITAPTISALFVNKTTTTASFSWQTDEASSTQLRYGLTNTYGTTTAEQNTSPRVTTHSVNLSGLRPCTVYYYQVISKDSSTNTRTNEGSFVTTGCLVTNSPDNLVSNAVASASGGTVSLVHIALTIPSDFSASDAAFQIVKLEKDGVLDAISQPMGVNLVSGLIYQLTALSDDDTSISSFDEPITIQISYDDEDVDDMNESSLRIYTHDGAAWTMLSDCVVNTGANTVTCTTEHFSTFGLFGQSMIATSSNPSHRAKRIHSTTKACRAQKPGQLPTLYQVDRDATQATLWINPGGNPYTGFVIWYGLGEDTSSYATVVETRDSSGMVKTVVADLDPTATYSFKVQAKNECMYSDASNVITVTNRKQEKLRGGVLSQLQQTSAAITQNVINTVSATKPTPAPSPVAAASNAEATIQPTQPTAAPSIPENEGKKSNGFWNWIRGLFGK